MLTSLCLLAALLHPKAPAQVQMLDATTVLVIYTDTSMALGPLASFTPTGLPIPGAQLTTIEAPTSEKLETSWVDARGMTRRVLTDCVTLKIQDCIIQHNKAVDLQFAANPAPKPVDK